jgi:hypothetical protein
VGALPTESRKAEGEVNLTDILKHKDLVCKLRRNRPPGTRPGGKPGWKESKGPVRLAGFD